MSEEQHSGTEIAIIGMVGRFPGAPDLEAFWRNLRDGVESIDHFTEEELLSHGIEEAAVVHPRYVKARGVVDGAELFDADFFGYSPREAEIMDPQHRLFLEGAWEAMETAGYASEEEAGPVGVFGSVGMSSYMLNNLMSRPELLRTVGGFRAGIGGDKDYLATRVSYKLDLTGPSLTVQTACSSSLVAIHMACQSLLNFECDMALAGGVAVGVPQRAGYWYEDGGIASPDGHCRAFADAAAGTVFGDGVGIVVLKRAADALADGDRVRALLVGSAVNNDGGARIGYTAPGTRGQSKVITEALAVAGVEPETVTYVEAHGTGTAMGDPIEVTALTEAYTAAGATGRGYCALGSLKSNIGHLGEAAGVAGLLKTVLALEHGEIPPSLHCARPSSRIDFASSPFFVNTELRPWRPAGGALRRAGVSSFGIGGTNAHAVLEEAPAARAGSPSRPWQVLLLSAKTERALAAASENLAHSLECSSERGKLPDLADVAFTLRLGRRAFSERRALVCRTPEEAIEGLRQGEPRRGVARADAPEGARPAAFLFPGQGAQRPGMLRGLEGEPAVRREVERAAEILREPLGLDLGELLFGGDDGPAADHDLSQTALTQPALFVTELALARLWMEWGITPQAMIGHSIGEWVAACLAGVISVEDALALVAARGRLVQSLPTGAMVALRCSGEEAGRFLDGDLSLAAANGPRASTLSGTPEAVSALEERLKEASVEHRRLAVSHAFHSAMVEPVLAELEALVRGVTLREPSIPFVSNVTGTWITDTEATDPAYWARHLRSTVRFGDGLAALMERSETVLLEVGPGRALAQLARQQQEAGEPGRAWSSLPPVAAGEEEDGLASVLLALGALWAEGVEVDWKGFQGDERRRRVPLPTYPFERVRHWVDPKPVAERAPAAPESPTGAVQDAAEAGGVAEVPEIASGAETEAGPEAEAAAIAETIQMQIAEIWKELLGVPEVAPDDDFFDLGGDSLLGTQLITRIHETFPVQVPLQKVFDEPTLRRLAAVVHEEMLRALGEMSEVEAEELS